MFSSFYSSWLLVLEISRPHSLRSALKMLNMSLLDLIESSKFMLCVALYTANMLTGLAGFECQRSAVLLEVDESE